MKLFKRALSILTFLTVIASFSVVSAMEVVDVKTDYWAAREITNSLVNGYLTLNEKNQFLPEGKISRSDFVNGLVKVLGHESLDIFVQNELKDITGDTKNIKNILIAEQLRIIYGYPDKTFKPNSPATRAEASSALGHITKGVYTNTSILARFKDGESVPDWALFTYAKAVKNGFYINYPNKDMLRPNDYLTRAEAAVLFDKVSKGLDLIESEYKNDLETRIKDELIGQETLSIHKKPLTNVVEIYNTKKVIKAGNIIKGTFVTPVNFKKAQVGDIVEFRAPEDVTTNEGTFMYGAGTKFTSKVLKIKKTAWRDKNGKTLIVLDKIQTPEGIEADMAAVPLSRDRQFLWFKWSKLCYTKDVKHIDWVPKKKTKGKFIEADYLLRYSYKVSPRVRYKNNEGDEVYILLTDDLIFRK